jgi:uncharacterized protein (TIGR03086 family)
MDIVDLDARAAERLGAIVAAVSPSQWASPTPCSGWSVRDLVAHLVLGNIKWTGIAKGDDWRPGGGDVDLGDDPAATYRRTVGEMLEAWRQPGALDRETTLPGGQRGRSEVALWIHLAETLVHGWDLARATGQGPDFDLDVVEASLAECQRRVPPARPEGSPFGPSVPVGASATPLERLAGYLGRSVSA